MQTLSGAVSELSLHVVLGCPELSNFLNGSAAAEGLPVALKNVGGLADRRPQHVQGQEVPRPIRPTSPILSGLRPEQLGRERYEHWPD
jgi:hypothetical protein